MSILSLDTVLPAPLPVAGSVAGNWQENQIASSVESALNAVDSCRRAMERRRENRHPYPYPIHLTPLLDDGTPDVNGTFVVIGKHLAAHGIDFYCSQPLPHRRVIASLDGGSAGWIGIILELTWCRFSRHGWYDNGGRFVAMVRSPLLELDNRPRAA
jgi:hypothetical protein